MYRRVPFETVKAPEARLHVVGFCPVRVNAADIGARVEACCFRPDSGCFVAQFGGD